jgi:hypothetical protein
MTDIMMLDRSGGGDDGLLVPFSRPTAPTNETEPIFSSKSSKNSSNSKRGLGRFFGRRNSQESKENMEEELPLKVTTFAFPKARVEQAEFIPDPYSDDNRGKEPQDDSGIEEDSEEEESDDDDDEDDDDEEEEKEKTRNRPVPRNRSVPQRTTVSQKKLTDVDKWDPTQNPYYEETTESRSWRIEGYGSAPLVDEENKPKGLGGLWRSLRGRNSKDDLKSMKVATEDTKDDMTMAEQIAKTALVVLVPELFADDEDGDGNLGMYRSICVTADEDADRKISQIGLTNEVRNKVNADPLRLLQVEVNQLRGKVIRMEKELKSTELEAMSWRQRCGEMKKELRRYKGRRSDDDSSSSAEESDMDNNVEMEEEEDDGIEDEWKGYDSVKEGNLLDMPTMEQDGFSLSAGDMKESQGDTEGDPTNLLHMEELVQPVFDPLDDAEEEPTNLLHMKELTPPVFDPLDNAEEEPTNLLHMEELAPPVFDPLMAIKEILPNEAEEEPSNLPDTTITEKTTEVEWPVSRQGRLRYGPN